MPELTQISHSRVESALLCERKDYYGYRLGLKRRKESASLGLGTAGHACLQALYEEIFKLGTTASAQRKAWPAGVAAMWAKYEELVLQGWKDEDPKRWALKQVLEHYIANERIVLAGWRVLAVEKEFHVRWRDDSSMLFKVDMIAVDPKRRRVVVDHKFVWDFYSPDMAGLQPQLPKYVGMLRFLGHDIAYGAYNMLRTRKVAGESMLKAELVDTIAKAIGIADDEGAVKILAKHKVEDLRAQAEQRGIEHTKPVSADKLVQFLDVPMSDARVRRTLTEQFEKAGRLLESDKLTTEQYEQSALRVANNMVCKSCSFRLICKTELNEEDTRLVMQDYEHRDPRELPELLGEEDDD